MGCVLMVEYKSFIVDSYSMMRCQEGVLKCFYGMLDNHTMRQFLVRLYAKVWSYRYCKAVLFTSVDNVDAILDYSH